MPLILPNNTGVVFPKNAFIYLNEFKNLELSVASSSFTPGIYDIAYYLSSFNFVATTTGTQICTCGGQQSKTDSIIDYEIQIMQLALSFNPNMNFYIYIDGSEYVDTDTLSSQIQSDILDISNKYNFNQQIISGVYVSGFDFQSNIGAGHPATILNPDTQKFYSGLTFRNVQNIFQISVSANSLDLAISCNNSTTELPNQIYSSGNIWITNLPFVLNTAYETAPKNSLLFFQNQTILIDTSLYGSGFNIITSNYSGFSATGYANIQDFMNNLMILNLIYSSNFNYGLQVMLCVTAVDPASFNNPAFFVSATPLTPPAGIAETVFLLTCWLGLDYICTSAYEDFYRSETENLAHGIFPFTNQYGQSSTYLYTPKGKLIVVSQSTIGYKNNQYNNISISGPTTMNLTFNTGTISIVNF